MYLLYVCVKVWNIPFERSFMYSLEFMRYLINYQKGEYNEHVDKQIRNFRFNLEKLVLASVLLVNKK